MLVYHGSDVVVEKPQILTPNRTLDYGSGFYTTMNLKQAESFAFNVLRRNEEKGHPTVSYYEIDYDRIMRELHVLKFDSANEKWLDFVYANRAAHYFGEKYDVVIGPVANDSIYRVFRLYENGDIDRETAIRRLKVTKLYSQMTFCTQIAVRELKFIKSEVILSG